jgi:hypothetical protein
VPCSDSTAPPYSPEEMQRERERHARHWSGGHRRPAVPIQASEGFHLCALPHAGQHRGTATAGRDSKITESALSPVETGRPVVGHLVKIYFRRPVRSACGCDRLSGSRRRSPLSPSSSRGMNLSTMKRSPHPGGGDNLRHPYRKANTHRIGRSSRLISFGALDINWGLESAGHQARPDS